MQLSEFEKHYCCLTFFGL